MNENHLSDEELIDCLYGVGAAQRHVANCSECQGRLDFMRLSRGELEAIYCAADALSHQELAAQRRAIYARIDSQPARSWLRLHRRVWASAALAIALLGGGWALHKDPHRAARPGSVSNALSQPPQAGITDAELADQVSEIADDAEPTPAAPLKALFED